MMHVIAHRGARNEYPENSLEGIKAAINIPGVSGVEFDIELSKDHQPIVLHQETLIPNQQFSHLQPATRDYLTRDWVAEHSLEDIQKLDAGSWFGASFSNVRCPSLKDVLKLDWKDRVAFIELKDATYWSKSNPNRAREMVDAALPYLQAFRGQLNVISFNAKVLEILQQKLPGTPSTLALWLEWQEKPSEAIATAKSCGAANITLADRMVLENSQWITLALSAKLKIHAYPITPTIGELEYKHWNAESQREKWLQLSRLGIDGIVSDFPRETARVFHSPLFPERPQ